MRVCAHEEVRSTAGPREFLGNADSVVFHENCDERRCDGDADLRAVRVGVTSHVAESLSHHRDDVFRKSAGHQQIDRAGKSDSGWTLEHRCEFIRDVDESMSNGFGVRGLKSEYRRSKIGDRSVDLCHLRADGDGVLRQSCGKRL